MERIQLAKEPAYGGLGVEKAIASRRSERSFSGKTMSLAELSHILYYTGGIADKHNGFRAALGHGLLAKANVVLVLSAVFQRTQRQYGERGQR